MRITDLRSRVRTTLTTCGFALVLLLAPSGLTAEGEAYAQPLNAFDAFRDCERCPVMVALPPGQFVMGTDGPHPAERPPHTVVINYPFAIGRFEVTFDDWAACVDEGGCAAMPDDHKWGEGIRPVINITFDEAEGYAKWLSRMTGAVYRLASEAEWEYAARGGTTTEFFWGDEVGVNLANCRDCESAWSKIGSGPTGSFAPNPFGLYDMSGNVWEWVQDCWNKDYTGAPADGSAWLSGDCKQRGIRGGSWYYFSKNARSAWRFKNDSRVRSYGIGFRVVREFKSAGQ